MSRARKPTYFVRLPCEFGLVCARGALLLGLLKLLKARGHFLALLVGWVQLQRLLVLFRGVGALTLRLIEVAEPFARGGVRGPIAAIRRAREIGFQIAL